MFLKTVVEVYIVGGISMPFCSGCCLEFSYREISGTFEIMVSLVEIESSKLYFLRSILICAVDFTLRRENGGHWTYLVCCTDTAN